MFMNMQLATMCERLQRKQEEAMKLSLAVAERKRKKSKFVRA
jgi:hypothetical protein